MQVAFSINRASPFVMHGNTLGIWENVFFDADAEMLQRVMREKVIGDIDSERFDEPSGAFVGDFLEFDADRVVIDGARNVIVEQLEAMAGSHADRCQQRLWLGAFFIRHADESEQAEAANFDEAHGVGELFVRISPFLRTSLSRVRVG